MKQHLTAALVAAGLAFGAGAASAASLGLTTGTPTAVASSAEVEFFDIDPDGDLSVNFALVDFAVGLSLLDPATIDIGIGFSKADPTDLPGGGFTLFSDFGADLALTGDLVAVGFFEDTIELLFGSLTGSAAASFGAQALITIVFADPLGDDPFGALVDGEIYDASITLANVVPPSVVPLPAGLVLMLSGVGAFSVIRARRRAALA